jgi:hypothetical protein
LVMAVQNPPVKGGFEPPVMSFSGVVEVKMNHVPILIRDGSYKKDSCNLLTP